MIDLTFASVEHGYTLDIGLMPFELCFFEMTRL